MVLFYFERVIAPFKTQKAKLISNTSKHQHIFSSHNVMLNIFCGIIFLGLRTWILWKLPPFSLLEQIDIHVIHPMTVGISWKQNGAGARFALYRCNVCTMLVAWTWSKVSCCKMHCMHVGYQGSFHQLIGSGKLSASKSLAASCSKLTASCH